MQPNEWSRIRHDTDLQLDALQARFTTHAFARHWHDYYVIGLVEAGAQSFWCRRNTFDTPPGGLILLNPGEAHTGEAAIKGGFAYRAFYPTPAHLAPVMAELKQPDQLPLFPNVRVDDPGLANMVRSFHSAIDTGTTLLERETRLLGLLTTLVVRYGAMRIAASKLGAEPQAIVRVRAYLEEHYAEQVTLATLAEYAGLSAYHLVRVFHKATGVPPHAYLESIRIRHSQQLLAQGVALAEIAYATGFSSQSHFTARFRRIIGVTPGAYRRSL